MMTSYVSTGVPTIEVFQLQQGEIPGWLPRIARSDFGRRLLGWLIDTFAPEGPPPGAQEQRQTRIVSTASNAAGESASAALITPEAYYLTFHSALIAARRVIDGDWEPGFQTPAKAYGADLVLEVPGVTEKHLVTTQDPHIDRLTNHINQAFVELDCHAWALRPPMGPFHGCIHQLFMGNDPVDDAQFKRLLGINEIRVPH